MGSFFSSPIYQRKNATVLVAAAPSTKRWRNSHETPEVRFTPLEAEIRRAELQDLACFAGIAMKFQEAADLSDGGGHEKG